MADVLKVISNIVDIGKSIVGDDDVKKFLCGTYADGSTRNLTDAINGDFLSPKQKKKAISKKGKKKKKNTKFKL